MCNPDEVCYNPCYDEETEDCADIADGFACMSEPDPGTSFCSLSVCLSVCLPSVCVSLCGLVSVYPSVRLSV